MPRTPEERKKHAEYMRNYLRIHPEQRKKAYESAKRWRQNHLKERRLYQRNYYATHPEFRKKVIEHTSKNSSKYYYKVKKEVFAHYSNNTFKCACCGEGEYIFLTLDHTNNDGAKHRRELTKHRKKIIGRSHNPRIYSWVRKNNYPKDFQVLCHNCNWAKRYGICPHKLSSNKHTN